VSDALAAWAVESVSAERMRALAAVLGDPNPIHLDAAAVRALGLGDRQINQGPANLGYVINMLQAALPGAAFAGLRVRFLAPVFAGDRAVAGGRVEARAAGRVDAAVWLDVDGGPRAVEGTATLILPPD
jgi:3-hydroxybutyryl-CoA dehydratase